MAFNPPKQPEPEIHPDIAIEIKAVVKGSLDSKVLGVISDVVNSVETYVGEYLKLGGKFGIVVTTDVYRRQ